jgi:hypothetical protein
MLVLSRRLNEKVVLPNIDTTFEVFGIRSGAVRSTRWPSSAKRVGPAT